MEKVIEPLVTTYYFILYIHQNLFKKNKQQLTLSAPNAVGKDIKSSGPNCIWCLTIQQEFTYNSRRDLSHIRDQTNLSQR